VTHRAYIGIGANLGEPVENVGRALDALGGLGSLVARSSLYDTQPWGKRDQPRFVNAVAALETELAPRALLDALQAAEKALGRVPNERWGARHIDLDLLLYDDLEVAEPGLRVPHPRMRERAFVLVPLAEVDQRFAALRDSLSPEELAGVVRVERESDTPMPEEALRVGEHVRALARFLAETGAVRVRVARGDEEIEIEARSQREGARDRAHDVPAPAATRVDAIKADLVGIFHLSRPAPKVGDVFDADRELGFVEALGIRTAIHSMGAGRLVSMPAADGAAVEYGQALFLVARGN